MQVLSEINIDGISIIIKKKEKYNFLYRCEKRYKSGFILITEGNGFFETPQSIIPIQKNSLIILNDGDSYAISSKNNDFTYITSAFNVYPDKCFDLLGLPVVSSIENYPYLITMFESLLNTWEERTEFYIFKSKILLEQIMLAIYDINSNSRVQINPDSKLSPAINYINRFYDKEISVEELAAICKLSVSHFRKIFKEQIGISPLQYREALRINWAKQLLKSDLFTISEIAEKLGYYDIYHFSKSFKNHIGLSPKQYLNNYFKK